MQKIPGTTEIQDEMQPLMLDSAEQEEHGSYSVEALVIECAYKLQRS